MLGDFNARVGKPDLMDSKFRKYEYINICDETLNTPGKKFINLCKENSLVIANHLKYGSKTFGGNLSYRKGRKWISELDLCLVHEKSLPLLKEVIVKQEVKGSDHAPLCVSMDINSSDLLAPLLLDRARNLGQSYFVSQTSNKKLIKTDSYRVIDIGNFKK